MNRVILVFVSVLAGLFLRDLYGQVSAAAQESDIVTQSEPATAPAYLVVVGKVYQRDAFFDGYVAELPPVYAKYGGTYLALGRDHQVLEGAAAFESFVISRWPSIEAARAFWNSDEYAPLRRARIDGEWGDFDVYLFPGLPERSVAAPDPQ